MSLRPRYPDHPLRVAMHLATAGNLVPRSIPVHEPERFAHADRWILGVSKFLIVCLDDWCVSNFAFPQRLAVPKHLAHLTKIPRPARRTSHLSLLGPHMPA